MQVRFQNMSYFQTKGFSSIYVDLYITPRINDGTSVFISQ